MRSFCKKKISNGIIIPSVFLLAIAFGFGAWGLKSFCQSGTIAEITKDGKVIEQIPLSDATKPITVNLGGNVVVIENDGVRMKSASCPDKLCVHQGKIKSSLCPIVCLPNKVTVKIIDGGGDVDAVTGK